MHLIPPETHVWGGCCGASGRFAGCRLQNGNWSHYLRRGVLVQLGLEVRQKVGGVEKRATVAAERRTRLVLLWHSDPRQLILTRLLGGEEDDGQQQDQAAD